jgi:aryl-alcohol dehydrogenase-like predicted oxidoreductase
MLEVWISLPLSPSTTTSRCRVSASASSSPPPERRPPTPVTAAIAAGYRSIDTATFYANEESVGAGIRASGVPREELFITTKVWNSDQGYDRTIEVFHESLKLLGLDYLDLYLVHWPIEPTYLDTWRALEALYREKKVRAIGVSNFEVRNLERVMRETEIVPAVNQIELHPYLQQKALRHYCADHGIAVEAWSPIARGGVMEDETLRSIGSATASRRYRSLCGGSSIGISSRFRSRSTRSASGRTRKSSISNSARTSWRGSTPSTVAKGVAWDRTRTPSRR